MAGAHLETVDREMVKHHNLGVRVNMHVIQKANNHAKGCYAGAPVVSVPRVRENLTPDVQEHFTRFITDKNFLTIGDASVKRKTTVTRKIPRAELYVLYLQVPQTTISNNQLAKPTSTIINQRTRVTHPMRRSACVIDYAWVM